jgi:hypothetical protein
LNLSAWDSAATLVALSLRSFRSALGGRDVWTGDLLDA